MSALVDDPVLWHEGMLLTPQHFQQHDIYWQRQLRHQLEQLQPYYWGLLELKYSAARLDEGVLQIDAIHAVLPDGLVVAQGVGSPSGDARSARLSLDLSQDPTLAAKGRVKIYLCVPLRMQGAASDRAQLRRYDSFEGPSSVDENTGEDPLAVLRLKPRVQLFAGLAPPKDAAAMPILEVKQETAGHCVVTNYHPPLLSLAASEFLQRDALQLHLEELVEQARRKAVRLAAMRGNRSQNLYALTAALPALEVLVHSRRAHPFEVYKALASMVGHASALHIDGVPPLLEGYQHEQVLPGFLTAIRFLEDLLESLDLEFELLAFERKGPDAFALMLDSRWSGEELVIELAAKPGQSAAQLQEWLESARIGTDTLHGVLSHQRSPGAWTERMSQARVAQYTHRPEAVLFLLKNRHLQLQDRPQPLMSPGEVLLIEGSGQTPAPEGIVLYARRADTARGKVSS